MPHNNIKLDDTTATQQQWIQGIQDHKGSVWLAMGQYALKAGIRWRELSITCWTIREPYSVLIKARMSEDYKF